MLGYDGFPCDEGPSDVYYKVPIRSFPPLPPPHDRSIGVCHVIFLVKASFTSDHHHPIINAFMLKKQKKQKYYFEEWDCCYWTLCSRGINCDLRP